LIAGFFHRGPSLVTGVAQQVINRAPSAFVRFGIDRLGRSDKPALVTGTIALTLLIGVVAGLLAARRRVVGDAFFLAFAVLGMVAALDITGSSAGAVVFGALFAAGAGIASLRVMLGWATQPEAAARSKPPSRAPETGRVAPPPCTKSTAPAHSRRRFLALTGGLAAAAVVGGDIGRALLDRVSVAAARAKVILPHPRRAAPPIPAGSSFAIAGLSPLVTPNANFYRIDTALSVPQVDPDHWTLKVLGRVDHPFELTFAEVLAMPMVEEYVTLSCVSNEVGGPLISNAKWLGVRLPTLLDRAGVQKGADQIVGRSVDDFTAGIPTAALLDGRVALLAVGMNGEPLPTKHGFPARLVVAGLYGYVSATKWVTQLEATTFADYDAYWVPRGWSQQAPIKTESRIDVPRGNGGPLASGPIAVAGVAWAPNRGINAVEVQVDNDPWQPAQLATAINGSTWRQWRYQWQATEGTHQLRVRATDGTGAVQTAEEAPPPPNGASGYHTIVVQVA
jgi:DMSO/TMAO reductase YedYZ molybdopterin-dependent catalytic subunit